jgi:hypothetical protein
MEFKEETIAFSTSTREIERIPQGSSEPVGGMLF